MNGNDVNNNEVKSDETSNNVVNDNAVNSSSNVDSGNVVSPSNNVDNSSVNNNVNYTEDDVKNGKSMAILSYFACFALIPYLTDRDNNFVVFHAKQGLNLFILLVICYFVSSILSGINVIHFLSVIFDIVYGVFGIVMITKGIVMANDGKCEELPVVKNIKIFK